MFTVGWTNESDVIAFVVAVVDICDKNRQEPCTNQHGATWTLLVLGLAKRKVREFYVDLVHSHLELRNAVEQQSLARRGEHSLARSFGKPVAIA
jgi:phage regulator Rha-like protein